MGASRRVANRLPHRALFLRAKKIRIVSAPSEWKALGSDWTAGAVPSRYHTDEGTTSNLAMFPPVPEVLDCFGDFCSGLSPTGCAVSSPDSVEPTGLSVYLTSSYSRSTSKE